MRKALWLLLAAPAARPMCSAPHRPSMLLLSETVRTACAALEVGEDEWLKPEQAAVAAACAIAEISLPTAEAALDAELPLQGEFDFPAESRFGGRCAAASEAAHAGDAQAQHSLGLLHYAGVGGAARKARTSAYWHAAAAAQGNIDALATLGGCVRRGIGAARDENVGLELIQAAAAAGSPTGLTKLGVLYDTGEAGLPLDPHKASRLFSRAASQGSALGLFNHGFALVHGIGCKRDLDAGFVAWCAAAKLAPADGSEEAAFSLYEEQHLLTRRQRTMYVPDKGLRLAADLGFEPAVAALAAREAGPPPTEPPRKKERFIRNDKARSWTAREERGEAFLDG